MFLKRDPFCNVTKILNALLRSGMCSYSSENRGQVMDDDIVEYKPVNTLHCSSTCILHV